jgi:hypothetical protein
MSRLEFRQILLATAIALAVMAAMSRPLSRPVSLQPIFDGPRELLDLDLCPGGGVLSCALER